MGAYPFRDVRAIPISGHVTSFFSVLPRRRQPPRVLDYRHYVENLSRRCAATLLIAPEPDDILFELCRRVETSGGTLLSSDSSSVQICADKLKVTAVLEDAGVRTVPARQLSWDYASPLETSGHCLQFPLVIKPRDGAGSQDNHLVRDWREFERLRFFLGSRTFIMQPYVTGRPVSVALLIPESGGQPTAFPVAEQLLSDDGRFFYRGGTIPARGVDHPAIQAAAVAACRCVPGLRGYVGVDLIVPGDEPARPVVVEINPRLTTSYLGYRALSLDNLAERMLPGRMHNPIEWRTGEVQFDPAGNIEVPPARPGSN